MRLAMIYLQQGRLGQQASALEKGSQILSTREKNKVSEDIFLNFNAGESPSPDRYTLPSGFRTSKLSTASPSKLPTSSFGAGREAFENVVVSKKKLSPDK